MTPTSETIISKERKSVASDLHATRACPHCDRVLELDELLCMVRGNGDVSYIKVRTETGREMIIQERDFNPQTMLLIDDGSALVNGKGPIRRPAL